MKKFIVVFALFLFFGISIFADNEQIINLKTYEQLYQDKNYELIIKELVPAILKGKLKAVSNEGTDIIHARNLVADTYRMLGKYTQAVDWYWKTNEGFYDGYSKYCLEVMQGISIFNGAQKKLDYNGYLKLLDNISLAEKQKYFQGILTLNADKKGLELYRYLAGEISLNNLLTNTSQDYFIRNITFAGLNLEVSGDLKKARELYSQVLAKESDKIETLLAANRMGLLALKMIYTTEEGVTDLSNTYAVKVSSAKLEDTRLYSAHNLIDDDAKTTWVPTGNKSGIGEWLEYSFDDPMQVNTIQIINGYAKSNISFTRNNRIKTATLEFDDGTKSEITLQDTLRPQIITVRKRTRTIRIVITGVYKGTMYDDTCLSDVELKFGK